MKKVAIFTFLVAALILGGKFCAEQWITQSGDVIDVGEDFTGMPASDADGIMTEQEIQQQKTQRMRKQFKNLVNDMLERARNFFAEAKTVEELQQHWEDRVEDFQEKAARFSAYPEYGYTPERAQKMLDAFVAGLNELYEKRVQQLQTIPQAPEAPWE